MRVISIQQKCSMHDTESIWQDRCKPNSLVAFLKCLIVLSGYKRWNDEGDFRSNAPYRDYDNIVDPVSGFVSAGGDADRVTGHSKIKSLVQLNDVPQSEAPQSKNSDRKKENRAPPELRRSNTYEPGAPSFWNSRATSDSWIKSQLGGKIEFVEIKNGHHRCLCMTSSVHHAVN